MVGSGDVSVSSQRCHSVEGVEVVRSQPSGCVHQYQFCWQVSQHSQVDEADLGSVNKLGWRAGRTAVLQSVALLLAVLQRFPVHVRRVQRGGSG